jgi:hypothetical protein
VPSGPYYGNGYDPGYGYNNGYGAGYNGNGYGGAGNPTIDSLSGLLGPMLGNYRP